jgi:hypothetical protein
MEKEEKRRGKFLKEILYPILLDVSENIEDAKIFLEANQLAINQAFMNLRAEKTVLDLEVDKMMKDNTESERYRRLLNALGGESVLAATDILNAMKQIIENNQRDQAKVVPLSSLPLKFFDE